MTAVLMALSVVFGFLAGMARADEKVKEKK
jgi:hypothetical protein